MRVALVGAGRVAEQHLRALQGVEDVTIGVCDRSPAAAEFAAERFGLAAWYTDYRTMLEELRPDLVHVTTPVTSHVSLASQALAAGAHVLVEKPIAPSYDEWLALRAAAERAGRWLTEDHAYQFSRPVQQVLQLIEGGRFGEVVHLDAMLCLGITAVGSAFADRHAPHPSERMPGGAISDFLPHLASLCWLFVGEHTAVQPSWRRRRSTSPLAYDELRALVEGAHGTAALGFSANGQPDVFGVRVYGTRMTATLNLFEGTLQVDRSWKGTHAWTPLLNGLNGGARSVLGAGRSLVEKLRAGPGGYDGLFELVRRTYGALRAGSPPPVGCAQIDGVQRLVRDLTVGVIAP